MGSNPTVPQLRLSIMANTGRHRPARFPLGNILAIDGRFNGKYSRSGSKQIRIVVERSHQSARLVVGMPGKLARCDQSLV